MRSGWMISVPACMSVAAIPAMTFEFRGIRKEVENGQYSPLVFLAANTVVQAAGVFLLTLACLVMPYTIANFHAPAFPAMMLLFFVNLWTFENMAQARLPPRLPIARFCAKPIS